MPVFRYNKLVRDKIYGWHEESGHTVVGAKLEGTELLRAMAQKLHEEADEVREATTRDELIEEMADVQQLLDDMRVLEGISLDEINEVKEKKQTKKGGFLEGNFIETVEIPNEQDEWAVYCRAQPDKYPEITSDASAHIATGEYIHTKSGKHYEVVGTALHTETEELLVCYRPMYESEYELFARPVDMFKGTVELQGEIVPRFEKV